MMDDTTIEPFVRNAWYVACWPDEIDGGILARTIMKEHMVLFRDANGKASALEDRCCHRAAPLSYGKMVETGIQCGYHGLVFDGQGKCVDIPGQQNIPPMAGVRAYPVVERNKIIWIWMGEPALADESKIVPYPWHDDVAKWPYCKEVMHINCNYMLMIDNLMDLTHLAYVHTKTIGGNPSAHVNAKMDIERTEHGAKYMRWMDETVPPPTRARASRGRSIAGRSSNTSCHRRWCNGRARSTSARARGKTANRMDSTCASCTPSRR
jgi:phenylpropionate dioxygenase-like ring-hydroxylating dioxygenase large terminal subunit